MNICSPFFLFNGKNVDEWKENGYNKGGNGNKMEITVKEAEHDTVRDERAEKRIRLLL